MLLSSKCDIFRGTIKDFFLFHSFLRIGYNFKFYGFYCYLECVIFKYLLNNFLKNFIYVSGIWLMLQKITTKEF